MKHRLPLRPLPRQGCSLGRLGDAVPLPWAACTGRGLAQHSVHRVASPSPLLPAGRWTCCSRVLAAAGQEVLSTTRRGSLLTSTPNERWRQGAESGKGAVNRIRLLKKGLFNTFSAQGLCQEMRRALLSSVEQQKAAVSYGHGFSPLLLRLPTGHVPPRAGSGPGEELRWASPPLFGEKTANG